MQVADADQHQEQKSGGKAGLDDGERGEQERHGLQGPAREVQRGAGQPARAPEQTQDQREPEAVLPRHVPRLHGLERDRHVVRCRRRNRGEDAEDQLTRHAHPAP